MLHVALSTSAAGLLVFCLTVLMILPFVIIEALQHRRRQRAHAAGPAPVTLIGGTVWRPEPEPRAEAEQAAGPEASAAAPRKPARPRKARKGTAGPGSAQDASQGQPGAADEATIDPDKQAGGLPVGSDG